MRTVTRSVLVVLLNLFLPLAARSQDPGVREVLRIDSPKAFLVVGETVQLQVTTTFPGGIPRDLTAGSTGTGYLSLNLSAATVGPNGLVTAVGPGRVTISAINGDLTTVETGEFLVGETELVVGTATDADGDGIADAFERLHGLDPLLADDAILDPDEDGLINQEEFQVGTDPQRADTDGDGLADRDEILAGSNPLVRDFDPGPRLNDECTAAVLNRLIQVSPDGTFTLANVAVPAGAFRVRFTCERDGMLEKARSAFLSGVANGATLIHDIEFVEDQVPVALAVTAQVPVLTASAPSVQLAARGKLVDGSMVDLTSADTGTFYLASNPAIATVSAGGLVTALSSGLVLITATNEGVVGTIALQVQLTTDADGDGLPDDYEAANAVNPGGSNLARLPGVVVTASSFSPAFPPARAVDGNPQTSWFTAVGDAANKRSAPFLEVVFPTDQSVAQIRLLGNRQNPEGFDFFAGRFQAFDAGGNEIFNSGEVMLPAPSRDVAVPVDLDGVRSLRFTATADESNTPGLAEMQVISRPGGAGLSAANAGDGAADFDQDGLSNLQEFNRGTNPFLNDTDNDGLLDAQEITLGSNPSVADTDNDGLADGAEVSPTADTDRDGRINILDPDSDGDGLPDGIEIALRLDPLRTDSNGNQIPDGSEDFDADGLPNGEEVLEHTDPANPDSDGDGLTDGEEALAGTDGHFTDPLRADTDRDGMPDGYESQFGLDPTDPADAAEDPDGDGLTNLEESQRGTDPFNADTVPPAVAQIVPADGAVNVAVNSTVIVRFTEPLLPAAVRTGVVRLFAGAAEIPGAVQLSSDGLSITFTPGQQLADLTLHNVRVSGVRDRAGNLLAAPFLSAFTTALLIDTVRPTVVRTSPFSSQSSVPVNAPITVEFSERMDPASLAPASWTVVDNTTGISLAGAVQVDADGRTASFLPQRALAVGRSHSVFLNTTRIKDAAGNLLTGSSSFSFTTALVPDDDRPRLLVSSPADGDTGIPVNALVVLRFDEPLNGVSAVRGIHLSAGASEVAGSFALSDGNRRVTFTSAAALAGNTLFTLRVTTEVTDLAGNPLDNPATFTFRTGTAGDVTRPTVVAVDPANSATGVGTNAVVRLAFSERMSPATVTDSTFFVQQTNGVRVSGTITVAADGRSATFTPSTGLSPSTLYQVQAFDATDLAGQTLPFFFSQFTTAAGTDTVAPTVVALSPPDGATGVAVNARLVAYLSEPVNPLSVAAGALALSAGGVGVSGAVSVSADRLSLVLTPASPLAVNTLYSVAVGGFTDRAGNPVVPAASSFATSASATADTARPAVAAVSPANGSSGVSAATAVMVTFNEAIDPGTVHAGSLPVTIDGVAGVVAGTYTVTGAVARFEPGQPLPGSARLRVTVNTDGVRDLAGNGNQFFQSFFDTAAATDATAPQVVLVTPSDGSTEVGPNAVVVLTFSESLNPNTVNAQTFALLANGGQLSTSVTRSADNRTVSLSATLPAASVVTVVATNDVTDLAGNRLADFTSRFTTSSFDAGRPSVVSQRPGNGATGVVRASSVVLYVNERLNPASIAGAVFVSQDGVVVPGSLAVTGNGRSIELIPDQPWLAGALIQVFVTPDARDVAGNPLNSYQGSFRTVADPSGQTASVVRSQPSSGSTGVPLNPRLEVEYSEPLDAATVTGTTVSLRRSSTGQVVSSAVSLERGGRVIRLAPASPLAASTQYSWQVNSGAVRDLSGQVAGGFFASFTTGASADGTGPSVVLISPPDGESGVGLNARVRVRFDEAVNPLSVDGQTVLVTDGTSGAVPCTISFGTGNRDVTIVPHAPLRANRAYTVRVEGVEDPAGNLVTVRQGSFQTGAEPDTTAPVAVRTNPFAGAAGVAVSTVVTLEANEPLDPVTVVGSTLQVVDNVLGLTLGGSYSVSPDGRFVRFVPNASLAVGRSHSVFYSSQGIEDLAGNRLTGSNFSFTTALTPDATAPQVVETGPRDGTADVPINARLAVRFSEPIAGPSLGGVALSAGGSPVALLTTLADANRTLTLSPLVPLLPLTAYTLTVDGVADVAGNPLPAPVTAVFTTEAGADLIRPTVVAVDPANSSTGVGTNVAVRLLFSERINPATVTDSTFFVQLTNGVRVAGTIAVAADGRSAMLTPSLNLSPSTLYQVQAFDATDLGSQTLPFFFSQFTTAAGADASAPSVVVISPPDGAAGVAVNARVAAYVSEPVSLLSVGAGAIAVSAGGSGVAGTVSVSADRLSLVFTPSSPLAVNTLYTMTVGGFTDRAGNPVSPASSSFTTAASATADTVRPAVSSVSPANGSTGVSAATAIVVTFNETIDAGTVHAGTLAVTIDGVAGMVAGTYTVTGAVARFEPGQPLPGSSRLRVTVNTDGVRDLAGNGNPFFQSFFDTAAAADATAPQVVLVTPSDGATEVGPNAVVVLTFSESLNPNTINAQTFALLANGGQLGVSVSRSADNRTVSLSATLPAASVVTVVATNDVTDLAGNRLADFTSRFTTSSFDTGRPSVVGQRPGNGATGVVVSSSVVLYVNERLDAASLDGAVFVSQNGSLVPGTLTVTGNGRSLEFAPDLPWLASALVEVFVTPDARDVAGNRLNSYQGSFRTLADPGVVAASVVRSQPSSGSTGVPQSPRLEVEYSEPLDPATVSGATASLRQSSTGQLVSATVSLERGGRVIRLTPASPLAASTQYSWQVNSGVVRDLSGQVAAGFFAVFTTGTSVDGSGPAVLLISPPDGESGVGLNARVRVRFDEPVNPLSVDGQTVRVSDGTSGAVPCTIGFGNGNRDVTIVPHAPLRANRAYTVRVEGVEDQAGNLVVVRQASFQTGTEPDTTAPVAVRTNPFPGAASVPVSTVVTLEANEPLDPVTVLGPTLQVVDNVLGQVLGGGYSVSPDGRFVRFVPNAAYAVSRSHSVFYSNQGIEDLAGNRLSGSNFSFTTASTPDTTEPRVVETGPRDGTVDVPINARLAVRFSEPIAGTSFGVVALSTGGSPVTALASLADANRTLTLSPVVPLSPLTSYTLAVDGVTDLGGNPLPAPVTATFTTETGADLIRPTVTGVTPANSSTGVSRAATVQIAFSERINPATVIDSNFFVQLTNGTRVAGSIAVAADGRSATFTPASPLAASTVYQVQAFDAADLAGQTLPFFFSQFTTGL